MLAIIRREYGEVPDVFAGAVRFASFVWPIPPVATIMPQAPVEYPVIAKAYDLLIWSARHIARFPRAHRFNAGDRMERQLHGILEKLLRAKFTRDRAALLRDVNMDLELLRFQFRAAKDLKCLTLESYGFAAKMVNEVGDTAARSASKGGAGPCWRCERRTKRRRPCWRCGLPCPLCRAGRRRLAARGSFKATAAVYSGDGAAVGRAVPASSLRSARA